MSERERQIKDPIYGYVYLPDKYVQGVIDTPEFQRLRKISQTSYEALYPAATHNRFAHSLGVFHLGSIVAKTIREQSLDSFGLSDSQKAKYDEYLEVYRLACLLHDVGHAPFSHTSEDFYLKQDKGREPLHEKIAELTGDARFMAEVSCAAAHELMSVIVALKLFGDVIGNGEKKSFFARAITGYVYKLKPDEGLKPNADGVSYSFLNALVLLLNSKVIDVDRLDYLIRDSFQTGYESINIDYARLLGAVRIKKTDAGYKRVFSKDALSVLENAVYAHDAEKKWIQTHLAICYETFLLQNAIKSLLSNDDFKDADVFGEQSISAEGVELPRGYKIRLMADGDISFLLKNYENEFSQEYFNRKIRKHPLWKTEHEYRQHFRESGWTKFFESLAKYEGSATLMQVNDSMLRCCEKDVADRESALSKATAVQQEECQSRLRNAQKMFKRVKALKDFAEELRIPFDFVILTREPFKSSFDKAEFGALPIEIKDSENTVPFSEATDVLSRAGHTAQTADNVTYYLFSKRSEDVSPSEAISKLKNHLGCLI